jgi:integrase
MPITSFRRWMERSGYRPSTVRQTVSQVDNVLRNVRLGGVPEVYQGDAIRRFLRWAEQTGSAPEQAHDLRVGDVLRTEADAIEEGLDSGEILIERKGGSFIHVPTAGSFEEWQQLLQGMRAAGYFNDSVASYVLDRRRASPLAGDAAYQRVRRRLRMLGQELGLPQPVHLQRIRRTLAVRALREEKDLTLVQGLLGHASLQSTAHYVDESRTREVGDLQRKLRGR